MQAVIKEITASKENAIKFLKEAGSPHALIGLTYTSSAVYGNKLRFTTRDVILQLGNLLFSSDEVLFHICLFLLKTVAKLQKMRLRQHSSEKSVAIS